MRFINLLALIVFCFAIGETLALWLATQIFDTDNQEIWSAMKAPAESSRTMLLTYSCLSGLVRFLLIPFGYLWLTDRKSLHFFVPGNEFRLPFLLMTVALFIILIPCTSVLMKANEHIVLPERLSDWERHLRGLETEAGRLTMFIVSNESIPQLLLTVLVAAIIPGICEEFFFRGIVQTQLYGIVQNRHIAIIISAALFSVLHFQFFGIIPRLALGIVLGYVYLWSSNLWYAVIAHVVNNALGILIVNFTDVEVTSPVNEVWVVTLSAGLAWLLMHNLSKFYAISSVDDKVMAR